MNSIDERPAGLRDQFLLRPNVVLWFAQMAVLPIPPCDGATLHRRLHDEFSIEIPICGWGGGQFVRLSMPGDNTHADVEKLIQALTILRPKVALDSA